MKQLNSILLVDDDFTANFLHKVILNDMGIVREILTALDGEEAIQVLSSLCAANKCPDLILLDINMPKMNGFEVLEKVKSLNLSNISGNAVVVMLSSSLNPSDVKRAGEMNAKRYLSKPLHEEEMRQLLDDFF